jgi:hypothetical protein
MAGAGSDASDVVRVIVRRNKEVEARHAVSSESVKTR